MVSISISVTIYSTITIQYVIKPTFATLHWVKSWEFMINSRTSPYAIYPGYSRLVVFCTSSLLPYKVNHVSCIMDEIPPLNHIPGSVSQNCSQYATYSFYAWNEGMTALIMSMMELRPSESTFPWDKILPRSPSSYFLPGDDSCHHLHHHLQYWLATLYTLLKCAKFVIHKEVINFIKKNVQCKLERSSGDKAFYQSVIKLRIHWLTLILWIESQLHRFIDFKGWCVIA